MNLREIRRNRFSVSVLKMAVTVTIFYGCFAKMTGMDGGDNIDIEMIDVQSIEAVIEHLTSDVSRLRMFLGMTQEYAFSYNRSDNIICIFPV